MNKQITSPVLMEPDGPQPLRRRPGPFGPFPNPTPSISVNENWN